MGRFGHNLGRFGYKFEAIGYRPLYKKQTTELINMFFYTVYAII